jgi:hypothetical protein
VVVQADICYDVDGDRNYNDPTSTYYDPGLPADESYNVLLYIGAGNRIREAYSCRDHGPAGEFCLDVGSGSNIEPRIGGVNKLELVMDWNVRAGVSIDAYASCVNTEYTGTATATADGSNVVTVDLVPAFPDQDCCEVRLYGAVRDWHYVATLAGDVDRDGEVLTPDASKVKSRFQDPVDGTNFVYDVDADGEILTVDASKVKSRFQNAAPACP